MTKIDTAGFTNAIHTIQSVSAHAIASSMQMKAADTGSDEYYQAFNNYCNQMALTQHAMGAALGAIGSQLNIRA